MGTSKTLISTDANMAGMKSKGVLYSLLGVDFGSQSIKAVAISGKSKDFKITAVAEVPTPKGAIVDYQINDIEKVTTAVKTLVKHVSGGPRYVATSVSGSSVISKIIQADANFRDSELSAFVEQEAEQLIPFPLDEISLDYEILGPNLVDATKSDVLLSGAKTESVESRQAVFEGVGRTVKVVDIGIHALARAVKATIPGFEEAYNEKPVALVDVGAVTLTFGVMYHGEVIYQRLQSFGGDTLTQNLCQATGMAYEDAEKAKVTNRMPGDAKNEIINPFMIQLAQNIKRNVQLFSSSSSHRDVSAVVLTGGGCLVEGFVDQMSSLLRMDVKCPDIFKKFPNLKSDTNQMGCKYMTALGLALRSFEECPI